MPRLIMAAPFPFFLTVPLLWLAFATALMFHGTDSLWFVPSFLALLGASLLFIAPTDRTGIALPRQGTILCATLYWLYLLFSLFWSTAPFISEIFFAVFSILPLLFFFLISGDREQARVKASWHGMAMLAALSVAAIWALIQYLFFYHIFGPRIHAPFLDPNNMATLMNMGLLPATALFLTAADEKRRRLYLTLTILFFAGLTVTQSRGGFISALLGFVVMGAMLFPTLRQNWRRPLILAGLCLLTALALQGYGGFFYSVGPAHNFVTDYSGSTNDRLALWQGTIHMIRDHPWMGPGLGTFYFNYSAYRLPIDHSDGFFAHMDMLQLWAETGLLGPLLLYAVMAAVLIRTLRALKAQPAPQARSVIAGTFAALLAVVLHSHINFIFYLPGLVIPLACLLAAWQVATETVLPVQRTVFMPARSRHIAFAAGVVLIIFAAQWILRIGVGVWAVNSAARAEAHGDVNTMDHVLALADLVVPAHYGYLPEYQARAATLRLRQDNNLWPEDRQRLLDTGLRANDRAYALNPGFAYLGVERARLYTLAQDGGMMPDGEQLAIETLQRALKHDPLSLEARGGLTSLYQRRGEFQKALDVMRDGLQWPRPMGQQDVDFLVRTANLCAVTGDHDCHDKLMAAAAADVAQYNLSTPAAQR